MKKQAIDPEMETKVYYHALYHHLAHWAAYVAMIGVLVSTGILLCLTPLPAQGNSMVRLIGIAFGVIVATLSACYFNKGMDAYGAIVNNIVPREHLDRSQRMPHNMMILSGFLLAAICGFADLLLLALLR